MTRPVLSTTFWRFMHVGDEVGKRLIVAEKPSVGRDLAAVLGDFLDEGEFLEGEDYVITWAIGHLLELAEPQDYDPKFRSWSVKLLPILPDRFEAKPKDGQKGRLALIKKLGRRKDVDSVINACDAGREGELIFRRVAEFCELDKKPVERLWMQSMTPASIREAFLALRPGDAFSLLGDAAWLRGVGDWLVGMNATRGLTQRLKSKGEREAWSAGRVQTPTLNLIVRREREIMAHEPRTYWELRASFSYQGNDWVARFQEPLRDGADEEQRPGRVFDQARVVEIEASLRAASTGSASEKRRPQKQSPPLLFDLTSLQREANRRFRFSAKRTLNAAQRLYEAHKLLTYPRTDSKHLPEDYGERVAETLQVLASRAGELGGVAGRLLEQGLQNTERLLDSSKISDHFAIVPTLTEEMPVLEGDDAKIYELVVRRFLAAFMGPATWATVERLVEIPLIGSLTGEIGVFKTTAKTLEVPGFLEALGNEEGDGTQLAPLVPGEDSVSGVIVDRGEVLVEEKETKPRPRLSEAQLLRMMETAGELIEDEDLSEAMKGRGLGTPATRADIIEGLVRKSYARRVEGRLAPTSKAIRLMDVLERIDVPGLASAGLTGEWERALADVEQGKLSREALFERFAEYTREIVTALQTFDHATLYLGEPDLGPCPECGEGRVVESAWGYRCSLNTQEEGTCNFMLWKDRFGRYIDRKVAVGLLTHGKVGPMGGFVDRFGRALEGTITLGFDEEKQRWVLGTEFGQTTENQEPEQVLGVLCPDPEDPEFKIVETNHRFVSERLLQGLVKSAPILPKVVCHRELSPEEATAYFGEDAKTEVMDGFVSKRGRNFRGALIRKATGKHGFEFPPREGGATAGAPAGTDAAGKRRAPRKAAAGSEPPASETPATP
ncbi:MAG: DNA topoisomerase III, partial [Deltaproteobacteria bacterium]|nr:DNA topoisomerase III [Deltaproteobacteria bacterium]